ncbi:hypothetical protein PseudUWO311_08520 [Pseudanabaena sp. UWO311]|uniref:hypothetical protein n=1 Tax=Pseudanabaena sp. UWO311 TaxID=2487337 RepID=UPI00115AF7A6|nr:hypothetical protein [Pseudanabaena sp. UWO311]TYQ27359.1 hypothetical protein PseudUWO311_08520 [Pseudanabaena sp. UWO311]
MKWINLFVLLNISILFVEGCQFQFSEIKEKQIEQKILAKIKQDNTEIANLEASYSINYVNFNQNKSWFGKNNFYIRNDVATVFYGYSLKDADIKVVTENNRGVLRVKLSPPKQVGSMSRYIVPNESNNPNYIPLDEKGQKADVEKYIKERLDKTIKTYEEKAINSTRTMSELYFQNIADRFGLKLELEFSPTRGTGEEKTDDKTQNKS